MQDFGVLLNVNNECHHKMMTFNMVFNN